MGWWLCKDWNTLMLAGDDLNVIFHIEYKDKHVYYKLFFSDGTHYLILVQDEDEGYPVYVGLNNKDKVTMFSDPHSGVVPIRDMLYDSELNNILQNEWSNILILLNQSK